MSPEERIRRVLDLLKGEMDILDRVKSIDHLKLALEELEEE